jgi:hypothetical protein
MEQEAKDRLRQLVQSKALAKRKDEELVAMAASRAVLEAEAQNRAQKLEEFQHIAADKDRQLHSLFESRSALEASARIQATELDMMHEKMQMMQQELAEATMLLPESVHTTSVARAAEAVEMALETNDEETREKMEAMEAELTKMLAALHMKQAMLGFHE